MRQVLNFYLGLIKENDYWIKFAGKTAIVFLAIGALDGSISMVFFPERVAEALQAINQVFEGIIGDVDFGLNLQSVWLIFRQNFQVTLIALFAGVFFGAVPFAQVALNFMIISFLFAVTLIVPGAEITPSVAESFLVSVIPHSLVEIPALLLATAFGMRLGYFWKLRPKGVSWQSNLLKMLKQNLQLLPLLILMLGVAAFVEIYVTGGLIKLLGYDVL